MLKKILIIGYGKIGKRYLTILQKKKNIQIIILKKKFINSKKINFIYNLRNIDGVTGVIIASPANTHFRYAKFFLQKKIPVLLEKPICSNINQANILKKLSFKNNTSLIINYSDLFDPNFIKNLKLISHELKTIKELKMNYGNNKNKYFFKKTITPSADWLPHPISIIISILKKIDNYQIIDYQFKVNSHDNQLFEMFKIKFIKKKITAILNFSNFNKTNMRNIYLETQKMKFSFDAYNNKNNFFFKKKKYNFNLKMSSFENITNTFLDIIKSKSFSTNIKLGIKEMTITFSILKKIIHLRKKLKNEII